MNGLQSHFGSGVSFCLLLLVASCNNSGATVTTGSAAPMGLSAMTVNGSINPHAVATRYYFEYGTSSSYGHRTDLHELPPSLSAYYHESWDRGFGGWRTWGMEKTHHPTGGHSSGFLRMSEPTINNDFNHTADVLHLMSFFYGGPSSDPRSAVLGGGDGDFRDARVMLWVRGNEWKPNGSELIWWTQSQSNIELRGRKGFMRANWGYTGFSLTDYLLDGAWNRVEYRLLSDTSQWMYGGSNHGLHGKKRWPYWTIDQVQAHVNCNFFHLVAGVDPHRPPTGSVDFDELEIAYRNESLAIPSNGGSLIDWPRDSEQDPTKLTDGWRHGKGRMWHSVENPAEPQEFTFSFEGPVTIDTVQIHQNPEWPGKDVEVLVSQDGSSYQSILRQVLPETGHPSANFAFAVDQGLAARASHLKIRLASGYQSRHWGLGEIEVFGSGATLRPDDDLYHVNADIYGLEAGVTYHYRLVAGNEHGTFYGKDQALTLPVTNQPYVLTGAASRIETSDAKVQGRVNPLGLPSYYYFEYGSDETLGSKTALRYAGLEETPRTVSATLQDLESTTFYNYRLVAINGRGTSYGSLGSFTTAALTSASSPY